MIRKLLHNFLNINASRTYVPYQDLENKHMLLGLVDQPELWVDHIRRYTNSLSTQMIFGFRTISTDDPRLLHLFGEFEEFSELATGITAALLDVFPILRLLPEFLLPEIKKAKALFIRTKSFLVTQLLDVKRRMKEGTALVSETDTIFHITSPVPLSTLPLMGTNLTFSYLCSLAFVSI